MGGGGGGDGTRRPSKTASLNVMEASQQQEPSRTQTLE